MHTNITTFQRMRRLGEEQVAKPNPEKSIGEDFDKNEANVPDEMRNPLEGQRTPNNEDLKGDGTNTPDNNKKAADEPEKPNNEVNSIDEKENVDNQDNEQTAELIEEQVEELDIEQVRAELDKRNIEYVHNTGIKKLKERLKEALRDGINE